MDTRWPHGIDEIRAEFGDPRPLMIEGGIAISPRWPAAILSDLIPPAPLVIPWDDPPGIVRRIRCHQRIAPALGSILARIHDAGLWGEIMEYGGCFNWRSQRGATRLSTHCWGIAIDLRVSTCQRGTPGDMPRAIVEAFAEMGATWGGRFTVPDPGHFQFCSGY